MVTPQEKLAEALDALRELQDKGLVAIRAADLSRAHRERLLRNGFLQDVMEEASVRQNIARFAGFLGRLVDEGLHGKPVAKVPAD